MKSKFRNKKIKEKRGITLIALVITIIVLLILAGVSISMLSRTKWLTISGRGGKKCNRKGRSKRKSRIRSSRKLWSKWGISDENFKRKFKK